MKGVIDEGLARGVEWGRYALKLVGGRAAPPRAGSTTRLKRRPAACPAAWGFSCCTEWSVGVRPSAGGASLCNRQPRTRQVLAGEVFSEEWRALVAARAGIGEPHRAIASIFGTADAGAHRSGAALASIGFGACRRFQPRPLVAPLRPAEHCTPAAFRSSNQPNNKPHPQSSPSSRKPAGVIAQETPLSALIRAWLSSHPAAARKLFGRDRLPTLAQYDPRNRLIEAHPEDGTLVISALPGPGRRAALEAAAGGGPCELRGAPLIRWAWLWECGSALPACRRRGVLGVCVPHSACLTQHAGHPKPAAGTASATQAAFWGLTR